MTRHRYLPADGMAQPRLRIFTPGRELPMAGHPTIGSAFVWAREHAAGTTPAGIVFEMGVGPIRVALEWVGDALRFAWMHQPTPVFGAVLNAAAGAHLAHALHLPPRARQWSGGGKRGRPSYIHIDVSGMAARIDAVRIGGTSRFVAEGVLTLP